MSLNNKDDNNKDNNNNTGALIQLASNSRFPSLNCIYEDFILTHNPDITFFKTQYRRYINFGKVEHEYNIKGDGGFGKSISFDIPKTGDFLNKMYLMFTLPALGYLYDKATRKQIINLLKQYDITYNPVDENNNLTNITQIMTDKDFVDVVGIINDGERDINNVGIISKYIDELIAKKKDIMKITTILNNFQFDGLSSNEFLNNLFIDLFNIDNKNNNNNLSFILSYLINYIKDENEISCFDNNNLNEIESFCNLYYNILDSEKKYIISTSIPYLNSSIKSTLYNGYNSWYKNNYITNQDKETAKIGDIASISNGYNYMHPDFFKKFTGLNKFSSGFLNNVSSDIIDFNELNEYSILEDINEFRHIPYVNRIYEVLCIEPIDFVICVVEAIELSAITQTVQLAKDFILEYAIDDTKINFFLVGNNNSSIHDLRLYSMKGSQVTGPYIKNDFANIFFYIYARREMLGTVEEPIFYNYKPVTQQEPGALVDIHCPIVYNPYYIVISHLRNTYSSYSYVYKNNQTTNVNYFKHKINTVSLNTIYLCYYNDQKTILEQVFYKETPMLSNIYIINKENYDDTVDLIGLSVFGSINKYLLYNLQTSPFEITETNVSSMRLLIKIYRRDKYISETIKYKVNEMYLDINTNNSSLKIPLKFYLNSYLDSQKILTNDIYFPEIDANNQSIIMHNINESSKIEEINNFMYYIKGLDTIYLKNTDILIKQNNRNNIYYCLNNYETVYEDEDITLRYLYTDKFIYFNNTFNQSFPQIENNMELYIILNNSINLMNVMIKNELYKFIISGNVIIYDRIISKTNDYIFEITNGLELYNYNNGYILFSSDGNISNIFYYIIYKSNYNLISLGVTKSGMYKITKSYIIFINENTANKRMLYISNHAINIISINLIVNKLYTYDEELNIFNTISIVNNNYYLFKTEGTYNCNKVYVYNNINNPPFQLKNSNNIYKYNNNGEYEMRLYNEFDYELLTNNNVYYINSNKIEKVIEQYINNTFIESLNSSYYIINKNDYYTKNEIIEYSNNNIHIIDRDSVNNIVFECVNNNITFELNELYIYAYLILLKYDIGTNYNIYNFNNKIKIRINNRLQNYNIENYNNNQIFLINSIDVNIDDYAVRYDNTDNTFKQISQEIEPYNYFYIINDQYSDYLDNNLTLQYLNNGKWEIYNQETIGSYDGNSWRNNITKIIDYTFTDFFNYIVDGQYSYIEDNYSLVINNEIIGITDINIKEIDYDVEQIDVISNKEILSIIDLDVNSFVSIVQYRVDSVVENNSLIPSIGIYLSLSTFNIFNNGVQMDRDSILIDVVIQDILCIIWSISVINLNDNILVYNLNDSVITIYYKNNYKYYDVTSQFIDKTILLCTGINLKNIYGKINYTNNKFIFININNNNTSNYLLYYYIWENNNKILIFEINSLTYCSLLFTSDIIINTINVIPTTMFLLPKIMCMYKIINNNFFKIPITKYHLFEINGDILYVYYVNNNMLYQLNNNNISIFNLVYVQNTNLIYKKEINQYIETINNITQHILLFDGTFYINNVLTNNPINCFDENLNIYYYGQHNTTQIFYTCKNNDSYIYSNIDDIKKIKVMNNNEFIELQIEQNTYYYIEQTKQYLYNNSIQNIGNLYSPIILFCKNKHNGYNYYIYCKQILNEYFSYRIPYFFNTFLNIETNNYFIYNISNNDHLRTNLIELPKFSFMVNLTYIYDLVNIVLDFDNCYNILYISNNNIEDVSTFSSAKNITLFNKSNLITTYDTITNLWSNIIINTYSYHIKINYPINYTEDLYTNDDVYSYQISISDLKIYYLKNSILTIISNNSINNFIYNNNIKNGFMNTYNNFIYLFDNTLNYLTKYKKNECYYLHNDQTENDTNISMYKFVNNEIILYLKNINSIKINWFFFNNYNKKLYSLFQDITPNIYTYDRKDISLNKKTILQQYTTNNLYDYVDITNNVVKYYKFDGLNWNEQINYNINALKWEYNVFNNEINNISLNIIQLSDNNILSTNSINNFKLFFNTSILQPFELILVFDNLNEYYCYNKSLVHNFIDNNGYFYTYDTNWKKSNNILSSGIYLDIVNKKLLNIDNNLIFQKDIVNEFDNNNVINNYLVFIDYINFEIIKIIYVEEYNIKKINDILTTPLLDNQSFIHKYKIDENNAPIENNLLYVYENNLFNIYSLNINDVLLNISSNITFKYNNTYLFSVVNLSLFSLIYIKNQTDKIYVYDGIKLYKYSDVNGLFVENDGFYFKETNKYLIYDNKEWLQHIYVYNIYKFISTIVNKTITLYFKDSNIKLINVINNIYYDNIGLYFNKTNLTYLQYLYKLITFDEIDITSYLYKNVILKNININNNVQNIEELKLFMNNITTNINLELITNLITNIYIFKTLINNIYNTNEQKKFKFVYFYTNNFNFVLLSDIINTNNTLDNFYSNIEKSNILKYDYKLDKIYNNDLIIQNKINEYSIQFNTEYYILIKNLTKTMIENNTEMINNKNVLTMYKFIFNTYRTEYSVQFNKINVTSVSPNIYNLSELLNQLINIDLYNIDLYTDITNLNSFNFDTTNNILLQLKIQLFCICDALIYPEFNTDFNIILEHIKSKLIINNLNLNLNIESYKNELLNLTQNNIDIIHFSNFPILDVEQILNDNINPFKIQTIYNTNLLEYVILSFTNNIKLKILHNFINSSNRLECFDKISILENIYLTDGINNFLYYTTDSDFKYTNFRKIQIPEFFKLNIITNEYNYLFKYPFDQFIFILSFKMNIISTNFNKYFDSALDNTVYDNLQNPFKECRDYIVNKNFINYNYYKNCINIKNINVTYCNNLLDTFLNNYYTNLLYKNIIKVYNSIKQSANSYILLIELYIQLNTLIYEEIIKKQSLNDITIVNAYQFKDLLENINYNDNIKQFITYSFSYTDENIKEYIYKKIYNDLIVKLTEQLIPLLKSMNSDKKYVSFFDIVTNDLNKRINNLLINPYTLDSQDYLWYQEYIVNILNNEISIFPTENNLIGCLTYFQTIESNFNMKYSYLYNWYLENSHLYNLTLETEKLNNLYNLNNEIYNNIFNPNILYQKYQSVIELKFNNFKYETDLINFLIYYLQYKSKYSKILNLIGITNIITFQNINNYYYSLLNEINTILDKLNVFSNYNGLINYSKLEDDIRNLWKKQDKTFINCSWIKEIGHYLVEKMDFYIGDQLIDSINGEFLHILYQLEQSEEQIKGYDYMIGNIPELYNLDNSIKQPHQLYVPINFFFNKHFASSLPLLCLLNQNAKINIRIRNLNDLIILDNTYSGTLLLNTLDNVISHNKDIVKNFKKIIDCKMICNYLLIDHKYRIEHSKHIQRMIIEQHHFINEHIVNLNNHTNKELPIIVSNRFYGISKELFIVVQLKNQKQLNEYLIDNKNILTGLTIEYNGQIRESFKNIEIYSLLHKYKFHTKNEFDGINIYSFSLYPEDLQPSGVSNFSKIGNLILKLYINWNVLSNLHNSKKIIRIGIYNTFYNFLNFIGGQAGLLYSNIDM